VVIPVEVRYRPLYRQEETESDLSIQEGVLQTLEEIAAEERSVKALPGDVLVFLVGEREIREMALLLRKAQLPNTEIVPLYARLGATDQNRIFQAHAGRRVILSTNVAETSLTVPGIRYVIDSGEVRISRYSYRSKVQRLPVEPISQASANQRKGRCGRVSAGVCYRLYSEEDFLLRAEFTDPEIQRTNLAAVILQMLVLKLGDIEQFPFMQPPERGYINDGYKLLEELGAVTEDKKVTVVGRQLARFPVDPRLARVILAGSAHNALAEILVIVSGLSQQDPRERPMDKQQAADEKHAQWADEQSDFAALVNLWSGYEAKREELSSSKIREYCRKQFLSYLRLREWRDTHRQLLLVCQELGLALNQAPAAYEAIHLALLTGLLTQVGNKDEKGEYIGPRQRRFVIAPGTRVRKTAPHWIVAAELTETQRLYARVVARIEPEWIERVAGQLLKATYSEPHWSKKRGEVCAYQQLSLYGLVVVAQRRVSYGRIDPQASREIFIREALVENGISTRAEFVAANQACIDSVEQLESKVRRKDLLVSEDQLYDFYDARIPADVNNVRSLESWVRRLDDEGRQALLLTREALLTSQAEQIDENSFPDYLESQGQRFPLHYHFLPGDKIDGVTVKTPLAALPQLPLDRLEWLVPGLLPDKLEALLRCLPKAIRKQFVPVPDFARALAASLTPVEQKLTDAMAARLRQMTGVQVAAEDWNVMAIPAHLLMNIQVLDESGQVLDQDRDYHALHHRLEARLKTARVTIPGHLGIKPRGEVKSWDFGDLPTALKIKQQGLQLELYPYLQDQGTSVALDLSYDQVKAAADSRQGVARLILLKLKPVADFLKKQLPHRKEIGLFFAPVGKLDELLDDFLLASVLQLFIADHPLPVTQAEFDALVEKGRADWVTGAEAMADVLLSLLRHYHSLSKLLAKQQNLALMLFLGDIRQQLSHLVFPGFLKSVPWQWIVHYPRYFRAIEIRLEKMPRQLALEKHFRQQFEQFWQKYMERKARHEREGIVDSELLLFRWMLEEFRVSVFAQQLGTEQSVSVKKLEKQFDKVRI
jgi:ATP-dependent helicase HrpA